MKDIISSSITSSNGQQINPLSKESISAGIINNSKMLPYLIPIGVAVLLGVLAIMASLPDKSIKDEPLPEFKPIVIKETIIEEKEVIKEVEVVKEIIKEVVREVNVNELLIGTAIRVIDGDTFVVQYDNGKEEKIRIQGIDAPENDQPMGGDATNLVKKMIEGKRVVITLMEKDRYGRRLASVGIPNSYGISGLSVILIRNGLAWHYKKYSDNQQLSDDEMLARRDKIGIWSQNNPVAPWDWRKGNR